MSRSKTPARFNTVQRYVEKHKAMLVNGDLSIPKNVGLIAICFSANSDSEIKTLRTHASTLAQRYADHLGDQSRVEVAALPSMADVQSIILDPNYASMVVMGHGSVGNFRIYEGRGGVFNNLSWDKVGGIAIHRKG